MTDLRCSCGSKLAEYDDTEVRIMDRKCKEITVLRICNGKLMRFSEQCDFYRNQLGNCKDESRCGNCICNWTAMNKKYFQAEKEAQDAQQKRLSNN